MHQHGPQCKPYKFRINDKTEVWMRPDCWPLTDPDDILKEIAIQKNMGRDREGDPLCERCGKAATSYPAHEGDSDFKLGETRVAFRYCTRCLGDAIKAYGERPHQPEPKKKKPVCRWCWNPRRNLATSTSAWCRQCRDARQREMIKRALGKLYKGERLALEDEHALDMAPYWSVWKKEFRSVKVGR